MSPIDRIMDDDAVAETIGLRLAEVLNLKKNRATGFYNTDWGVKSVIGLARCVSCIIREGPPLEADE